jgi:hypothetical protein
MGAAIRRIMPLALSVTTLILLAASAAAQTRDPLPEVRERLKIEAQRVEKEVQDGRMRAYRLIRSDPEEANNILKNLLATLEKDTALSEARRKAMKEALKRDIGNVRVLSTVRRSSEPAAEAGRVEARRVAEARAIRPAANDRPKTPYDAAAERIRSVNNRVAESRDLRTRREDRMTTTVTQVDRTAVPPRSDYDLPDDWAEKSKRRSPAAKLTDKEKALLKALKEPVKVDYNMETFQSVLDNLSKQMGQTILTDKQSLDEAGITYDTPITLRFNKPVSGRTALKRVLADVGLTYVIRKEAIEVTTVARAKEMLTVETYYVGDLVAIVNPTIPAIANQFQMIQAIGNILTQIQGIDPESWEGRGGPGTVTFNPATMSIIVKQSSEVHYMLKGLR